MNFNFVPMNKEYANEIAFNWKYEGLYSFYDMTGDEEDLELFLDENNWKEKYFGVLDDKGHVVGFYSYSFDEDIMWVGFGLKPNLTGNGIGLEFVMDGINFGLDHFNYDKKYIMLAVAKFNKRAIKVYERLGFEIIEEYIQETNGGEYPFVKMKKDLSDNYNQ
ncbi:GNAT family N-acetyltransferase [Dethiothermospora halolimnae]|uniref:GNAT family N-acetyltransferase n=1 Tax=Dethiothermospora halolimnae TaxID=3114390 RepID=UPI003CCC1130